MHRRWRSLEKLRTQVLEGAIDALDASHRAVQIVESTPQPFRLQDPRLTSVSKELIEAAKQKGVNVANLEGRLDRLLDEDSRVTTKIDTLTDVDVDKVDFKTKKLLDVVEFKQLYALLDEYKYLEAFEQLAAISLATWQRTPQSTVQQVLKATSTIMGHSAILAQSKMETSSKSLTHLHFLQFIKTLHTSKTLPPNWITLPTSIFAMKFASMKAKDATYLLHLVKAQNKAYAESMTLRYALAQKDLTEPHVVAPPPQLLIATIDVLDYLDLHQSIPLVQQEYSGRLTKEILTCFLRVLAQPRLPRKMVSTLSVTFTLDLVPYIELRFESALLKALVSSGLIQNAYDTYLRLHKLSPSVKIPGSIQTEILVGFYKRKLFDQFHIAYEEMWSRGYAIQHHEFNLLSSVVPPHVLQSVMGEREYLKCLKDIHIKARIKSEESPLPSKKGALDLRFMPASICTKLFWLHIDDILAQRKLGKHVVSDMRIFMNQPQVEDTLKSAIQAQDINCETPNRGEIIIPANELNDFLDRQETQRVKDTVWKLMVFRALGVYSIVVGAATYVTTFQ
ncbi:hypothetical protein THRCLA_00389 [Thraustotheca clavata]|uniref:Uncharacterized protein n=1 Tax=Thraustotheca clavata TaxID=74557 RepID=A0A1W0ABI0_9STRA|nr:hypothetical protein THRCLA_00389 [Thraustotheca clavata]